MATQKPDKALQHSRVDRIAKKINPFISIITNSKVINSIIGGMLAALPMTLIGAFASIVLNLNIGNFQDFVASSGIGKVCGITVQFTTNFLAVIYTIAIAYTYAKQYKEEPIVPALLSAVTFLILTPLSEGNLLSFEWLGAMGIFTGIFIALGVTRLYVFLRQKGLVIAMPDSVPPVVSNCFASLIPSVIIIILAMVVQVLFGLTSFGCLHQMIYGILQAPLTSLTGTFPAFLLLTFLSAVFWWFGIQGTMVTIGAVLAMMLAMDAENAAAAAQGLEPKNIAGWSFYYTFVCTNGMLGLNIIMLFARSKRYRTVGKITLVPSICGISEPILFGTPIVYDVWLFIPFVLSQVVPMCLAWGATALGILPATAGVFTAGGMPVILVGILQGGWKLAVAQVAVVALQVLIWIPFFRKTDRDALKEEAGEIATA